jgi:hypothetical protein
MATTDAGSGSSHQCQIMSGSSTTLKILTKTLTEIRATGMMVVGVWVRKRRYGGRDHFWMFFLFLSSSLLLFFGFRPSTNGVGTGFYDLRSQSNGGGFSLCAGSAERSPCVVPIGSGTYDFVQVRTRHDCITLPSHFFPFLLYGLC